jgi:predicted TPR repeat methyltransferase
MAALLYHFALHRAWLDAERRSCFRKRHKDIRVPGAHGEQGDPIAEAESLIATGRAHDAARALRARLAEGRGGALARTTLVSALLASGDVRGALAEAREAVSLNPDLPAVLVALGQALLAAENLPAAIAELQRALRLDPGHAAARFLTGRAWAEAGEADKALEIFTALDPAAPGLDAALLAHWQARAEAIKGAARSDPGYVRHLFDQFSADYDDRMRGPLAYAAPEILRDMADMVMHGRKNLDILDLGCGTGLSGAAFQTLAVRLDGMDLSPAMVEKAQARGIYDQLLVGDVETLLQKHDRQYDLIIAADTLVYLGDLTPLFRGVRYRLRPEGYFLFTAEAAAEGFSLGPKRRWRHAEAYLRASATAAGFAVAGLVSAAPRREANLPVEGFAVALAAGQKSAF